MSLDRSEEPFANHKAGREEEMALDREWYGGTSRTGRTKADFEALRTETLNATVLDFAKYRDDRDYRRLIRDNPHIQELFSDETFLNLLHIYDHREDVGLSGRGLEGVLDLFGPEMHRRIQEHFATEGLVKDIYGQFTPEQLNQHRNDTLAQMKAEILSQKDGVPHEPAKLEIFPSLLDQKARGETSGDFPTTK